MTGILLLMLVSTAGRAQGRHAAEIDRTVRAEMARRHIPGLALLISREHHVVHAAEYGVASLELENRRGAQPLHYAADANHREPASRVETIDYLLSVGADPGALDRIGVSPLHRAVRTRSLPAVRALLDGGADPREPNKGGSKPLHLAVQTTGRGGSGSEHARRQQTGIIRLLLERGASPTDKDGRGKQVRQAATSEWIHALLIGGSGGRARVRPTGEMS